MKKKQIFAAIAIGLMIAGTTISCSSTKGASGGTEKTDDKPGTGGSGGTDGT